MCPPFVITPLIDSTQATDDWPFESYFARMSWRLKFPSLRVAIVNEGNMEISPSPEAVVRRQLEAFNARDIEALMATYAEDAQQFEYPDTLLASGAAQLRARFEVRFQEPNLHARLINRAVIGQVVIDQEEVTRTFPEGAGTIELIAIYEVREGRIAAARFIYGPKRLEAKPGVAG